MMSTYKSFRLTKILYNSSLMTLTLVARINTEKLNKNEKKEKENRF